MCIMTAFRIEPLAECHREMFGDLVLTSLTPFGDGLPRQIVQPIPYNIGMRRASVDSVIVVKNSAECEKRRASDLVDQLLMDIYNSVHATTTDYNSTSGKSHRSSWIEGVNLQEKDIAELSPILSGLKNYVERMGSVLVRQLKRRDALRRQQDAYCDVITKQLANCVLQGDPSEDMRFSIQPLPGDTGFSQWVTAMKMVAQLPGGIPPEFRRRLWLTLADRHLLAKGVDWPKVERTCFSEWSHPADSELGVQIVKDLHRTGCSLFCGEDGQENQVLLKRVLLAYARWNKAVGYCQGFNMLAALILQVTDKCESDALKLMIYLIEGVLPDSYFADSLRGLSVDMAVFRELLRTRFPRLSKHLDNLQNAAKDGSRSYEPPLTNVFTMQWFLTLFCNCLPQPTVLRVWDLILLEGNEVLLRTALAIWQVLAERILSVRSADEFYCMMGVLTRELLEFELVDGNALIKAVVAIGPLTELSTLREHYLYNINPWGTNLPQVMDKQLKLYPKQSIALDIGGLKKQYAKLKQRQRQAHIIFSAAISRQPPATPPVTMNHLLLGKSALIPAKRIGPPKGAIPPARQAAPSTLHWKDAPKQSSSSSSSDTELCDEEDDSSDEEDGPKGQFDNLPLDSDTSLMKIDNTSATVDVDTISTHSKDKKLATEDLQAEDNLIVFKSESDEESFDFEQFLTDRLKAKEATEEKIDYSRRNSERALQIIQENSLILHRILQCQSRLSPSPPLETMETIDDPSGVATSFNNNHLFQESPAKLETDTHSDNKYKLSKQFDLGYDMSIKQIEELKSPEYGSKYTSILEKSKSLDEKYQELILNKPMSKTFEELSTTLHKDLKDDSIIESKPLENNFFTISEETTSDINDVQLNFKSNEFKTDFLQNVDEKQEVNSVFDPSKYDLKNKDEKMSLQIDIKPQSELKSDFELSKHNIQKQNQEGNGLQALDINTLDSRVQQQFCEDYLSKNLNLDLDLSKYNLQKHDEEDNNSSKTLCIGTDEFTAHKQDKENGRSKNVHSDLDISKYDIQKQDQQDNSSITFNTSTNDLTVQKQDTDKNDLPHLDFDISKYQFKTQHKDEMSGGFHLVTHKADTDFNTSKPKCDKEYDFKKEVSHMEEDAESGAFSLPQISSSNIYGIGGSAVKEKIDEPTFIDDYTKSKHSPENGSIPNTLDTDFKNYLYLFNDQSEKDYTDFKPYLSAEEADKNKTESVQSFLDNEDTEVAATFSNYNVRSNSDAKYYSRSYSLDARISDTGLSRGEDPKISGQSSEFSSLNSPLRQTPSTTCYSFLSTNEEGASSEDKHKNECDISPARKSFILDVVPCTSSNFRSPIRSPLSPTKSPLKSPFRSPSSPNSTFNPFPVPLSSRQSKEVPLKLGLYRK